MLNYRVEWFEPVYTPEVREVDLLFFTSMAVLLRTDAKASTCKDPSIELREPLIELGFVYLDTWFYEH